MVRIQMQNVEIQKRRPGDLVVSPLKGFFIENLLFRSCSHQVPLRQSYIVDFRRQ